MPERDLHESERQFRAICESALADTLLAAAVNVFWLAEGCRRLAVKWNRRADRCRWLA